MTNVSNSANPINGKYMTRSAFIKPTTTNRLDDSKNGQNTNARKEMSRIRRVCWYISVAVAVVIAVDDDDDDDVGSHNKR